MKKKKKTKTKQKWMGGKSTINERVKKKRTSEGDESERKSDNLYDV